MMRKIITLGSISLALLVGGCGDVTIHHVNATYVPYHQITSNPMRIPGVGPIIIDNLKPLRTPNTQK